jgi:hypothetical protein
MTLKLCNNEQCDRWTMISVDYCCSPCRCSDGGRLDGSDGGPKYMIEHADPRCAERQREFDAEPFQQRIHGRHVSAPASAR